LRSEIWWDTSGTPQCSIGRQKLAGFGQINARPEKPRLGKKPAAGTRVGKIATRNARLRLGLRAIAIANAGRVGCWIRCHWRRGQCDCGAVDRDSLYGGSQTVVDNGDGTQTIKYGNVGYNATTVALAALIGGAAGALLGTNATAAALAAQNEALNNATSDKLVKWVKETYKDPLGDLARWGKELLGMLPGQTPPTEANPLVDATNSGNPPATGGAVVTPPVAACTLGGLCVMTPPIAAPGAPGNAILSSDSSNKDSNSGATGSSANGGSNIGIDESRAQHIFRDSEGHVGDTPANRQLLETIANDPSAMLGTDKYGTTWAAKLNPDGTQTWVGIRGGKVSYGGINETPKAFNPQTGLASPTRPGK